MGVVPKNEQYVEQMVDILELVHEYVPEAKNLPLGQSGLLPIAMGGDQLTVARARTAQQVRVTDTNSKQAL